MPIYSNISGSQKELSKLYANIGGSQKELSFAYANIGGSQKEIHGKRYTWNKYNAVVTSTTYNWKRYNTSWGKTDYPAPGVPSGFSTYYGPYRTIFLPATQKFYTTVTAGTSGWTLSGTSYTFLDAISYVSAYTTTGRALHTKVNIVTNYGNENYEALYSLFSNSPNNSWSLQYYSNKNGSSYSWSLSELKTHGVSDGFLAWYGNADLTTADCYAVKGIVGSNSYHSHTVWDYYVCTNDGYGDSADGCGALHANFQSFTTPTYGYCQGSTYYETVSSTSSTAYPDNGYKYVTGVSPNPSWYVKIDPTIVYAKGTTSYGTVTSTNSNAYPNNGRHSDGYWYVLT